MSNVSKNGSCKEIAHTNYHIVRREPNFVYVLRCRLYTQREETGSVKKHPDEGQSLETSIFPSSFQVVKKSMHFAYIQEKVTENVTNNLLKILL